MCPLKSELNRMRCCIQAAQYDEVSIRLPNRMCISKRYVLHTYSEYYFLKSPFFLRLALAKRKKDPMLVVALMVD